MYWLRRLLTVAPWNRRARERELEEELRANLAMAEEDAGESPHALREARRDFGSVTRAREEARALWLPGWDAFSHDLRFACRSLRRAPVFTAVALLSLGLGIGAATALFSLVNSVVLEPLAYREPGKLLFVREIDKPLAHIYPTLPVNYRHFRFWRDNARSFESISALTSEQGMLATGGEPEPVGMAVVSGEFFKTLGVTMHLGRALTRADEAPKAAAIAVIADGLWRRKFNASPDVIGRKMRISEGGYTIAGVLPPSFRFPKNTELGPLTRLAERTDIFLALRGANTEGWGGDYDYAVFARLHAGVSESQGAGELNVLEQRIVDAHAGDVAPGLRAQTKPLQETITGPVRTSLGVLLAAVMLLALIVCVNLANLLLARGSARSREYAMRAALGASRARLILAALSETLLLSVAGGAMGAMAATAAVRAFVRLAPVELPRLDETHIDGRALAFAFGLSLICAMLFGLLPALRLARTDPQAGLRGRGATGGREGLRLREWLVGSEVALSALLLVLAGLLVNSLWRVLHVDRGFASDRTIDLTLMLPAKYGPARGRAEFFDRAVAALRGLPGVRAAAAASRVPLTGESNVNGVRTDGATDRVLDPASRQIVMVNGRFVSNGYFEAMGIPLIRGRGLEAADRDRNVAVISARLAAKIFPGQDPMGHLVTAGSQIDGARIVGVVGDVPATKLEGDPTMMVYAPYWSRAYQVADVVVRASGDPAAVEMAAQAAIRSLDSQIPAPKIQTMQDLVDRSVAQRRFQMNLAAAFAGAALLLAALGIYGVVAYGVSLQRRELGVRMAMGARAGQLRAAVVRRGLRPAMLGVCLGLIGALAAGRLVRTLLFGVAPTDTLTFAAVAALLLGVAAIACLAPAQSAARIDPARVLRDE